MLSIRRNKTKTKRTVSKQFTRKGEGQRNSMAATLGRLAQAITLPSEAKPWRYPTVTIDTQPTALWHLMKPFALSIPASIHRQTLMLSHCPLNPVWGDVTTTVPRTLTYTPQALDGSANSTFQLYPYSFVDQNAAPCYPLKDSTGTLWSYVPGGVNWYIDVTGFVAAGMVRVMIRNRKYHDTEEEQLVANLTTDAAGAASLGMTVLTEASWVNLTSVLLGGSAVTSSTSTIALRIPICTAFGPVMKMPALEALVSPLQNMRVNAAALLMSNTSAPLYKNGNVNAAKLTWNKTNIFWPFSAIAAIGDVHESLRFSGVAETGAYTFLVPSQASLNFSDYRSDGAFISYVGSFDDYKDVNYVSFDVAVVAGQPFTMQLRYDAHLEAITQEQIWNIGVPIMLNDEFQAVVAAAASLVPFTENPLHHVLMALGVRVLKHMTPMLRRGGHLAVDALADRFMAL